jgi:hypothetical protein
LKNPEDQNVGSIPQPIGTTGQRPGATEPDLAQTNQTLSTELAQAKDENESLQLSLMEQEEKHGATAARIQALVDRVSAGPVSA